MSLTEPSQPPQLLRPTVAGDRIASLDVARGLALFGIFMVNVQLMVQPLGWLFDGQAVQEGPIAAALHYATRVLFESKSYPLFSMLFGMGLILMHDRARAAGRSFVSPYLRRIALLLLMGVAHILLIWYGDILVYYACFGFCVMWLAPLRARTMLIIGVSMTVAAALWLTAVTMLSQAFGGPDGPKMSGLEIATYGEFIDALTSGKIQAGPLDPAWSAGETDAIGNGPFANAMAMRAIGWISGAIFWIVFNAIFLHIPGMFLIGGAIMRSGVVANPDSTWMRRFLLLGAFVGLPLSIVAVTMAEIGGVNSALMGYAGVLTFIVGPLVSLAYLGFAMWLARSLAGTWLVRAIAAAGRMALTNYLLQSLLVAALAQHWGLRWFGEVSRVGMVGIVLGVYSLQLIYSPLWLSRFSMGPLEYLWRCGTYLRLPRPARAEAKPS